LERSGLRRPERIDRLLLVVAIAGLISSLQGYAISLSVQRPLVDHHWKRGLSFARIALHWLQRSAITASRALLSWMPIPLQHLEPRIPSYGVRRCCMPCTQRALSVAEVYGKSRRLLDGFREPRRRSCLFPITTSLLPN
jgi:hypothetical protein